MATGLGLIVRVGVGLAVRVGVDRGVWVGVGVAVLGIDGCHDHLNLASTPILKGAVGTSFLDVGS